MKKILLGLLVIVLLAAGTLLIIELTKRDQQPQTITITIASWNIETFGNRNSDEETPGFIEKIAGVIEHFDVIALQEVMQKDDDTYPPQHIISLLEKLNENSKGQGFNWDYVLTKIANGTDKSHDEHYAVFFRTDRVQNLDDGTLVDDPEDVYSHEPFYASFQAGNFDFTLMDFHARSKENGQELMTLDDSYLKLQQDDTCENDVILLGDFNVEPSDNVWDESRKIDTLRNLIPSTTFTTHAGKSYDNIWIQEKYTGLSNELIGSGETLATDRTVSNHLPVFAEFRTDLRDDDGCQN